MGQKQRAWTMVASLSDSLLEKDEYIAKGTIITALVADENDKFYFVQKDSVTLPCLKKEGSTW